MIGSSSLRTIQIGKDWFPERPGGLDRYYYDLVRHLPDSGVAVRGFVTGSARVASDSDGSVQPFAPAGSSLLARWRGVRQQVGRALEDDPASLVVTHFALYALPCLDLLSKAPFVVHFQGPWSAESRTEGASRTVTAVKQQVEHSVYRRAARFVVLSRAFGQLLEEGHAIPRDRISVIPGGVDCNQWRPTMSRTAARAHLGWPTDRPIVFVVRRLARRMGLEGLIDSVVALRGAVPDVLVMIAGKGALGESLAQRAESRDVADHVRLAGFIPDADLPTAYRAADLSIVPSVALEGFGLVVAESLAAGTPVLVTDVGGLPETIGDLAPQCVLTDKRPAAIGAAIGDALTGRLPLPDADACMLHAREHFDWSIIARRVGDSYRGAAR